MLFDNKGFSQKVATSYTCVIIISKWYNYGKEISIRAEEI